MTNRHERESEVPDDSFTLERNGLVYEHLKALAEFKVNPIENDPMIDAYRTAMLHMLAEGEEPATSSLETIHKSNKSILNDPQVPPIYASNLYLRYLQSFLMDEDKLPDGLRYPEDFLSKSAWAAGMKHVSELDEGQVELVLCANRSIQSNVFDRYKAVKLAINMHAERFQHIPRILDVGCSQNLGLKIIESGMPFFNPTYLTLPEGAAQDRNDLDVRVIGSIERPSTIGRSNGVDLYPVGDPAIARWIKACSHYPSELIQKERVEMFDKLVAYESPNIGFVWTDFANPEEWPNSKVNTRLPEKGTVDIAVLSTILYQVSLENQNKMLDQAYDLLSDVGLLIVQDFVVVHENKPFQLDFSPWHHRDTAETINDPFPYKAFIWDKAEGDKGFQNLISWSNGRCREGKLGKYLLEEPGMLV